MYKKHLSLLLLSLLLRYYYLIYQKEIRTKNKISKLRYKSSKYPYNQCRCSIHLKYGFLTERVNKIN